MIPEIMEGNRDASGFIALGAGALLLVLGIVMMLLKPKQAPVVVQRVAPVPQQQVEIKRTEMNWGAGAPTRSASEDLQAELDAINQKVSRVKVQYGMGELSN